MSVLHVLVAASCMYALFRTEQELMAAAEAYAKFRDDAIPALPGFTAGFVTYHAFSSWATTYLKQSHSLSAVFGAFVCFALGDSLVHNITFALSWRPRGVRTEWPGAADGNIA